MITVDLAIIIPVYNEKDAIENNFQIINSILNQDDINPFFIFIDDGSKDETFTILKKIAQNYVNIKVIKFSKNFGKELAIFAGLDSIIANKYIIMDSDLQHPPKYIKTMLKIYNEKNCNMVIGIKNNRGKENKIYKFFVNKFYKFLNLISENGSDYLNSSDFMLLDRKSVIEILKFREKSMFFRGIVDCIGFKKEFFYFDVEKRKYGNSKFSINKLVKLAFEAIISNTKKPLFYIFIFAFIFFILSVILAIQTLINYITKNALTGFTTIIMLLLIIGTIIIFSLGIIGMYIAKIYDEVKNRPIYIKEDEFEVIQKESEIKNDNI